MTGRAPWLLAILLVGCLGDRGEGPPEEGVQGLDPYAVAGRAAPPEVWRFSEPPVLEIGVREGEAPYQLDRASGSVLLDDGRIVVLDGGSSQLRFFGGQGGFLGAVGSEGDGPGEFRYATRLRRTLGDSLQVWDAALSRLSFFDLRGGFLGSIAYPPSPADPMPLDEWLHHRSWIDSPLAPEERETIRRALRAMPRPDSLGPLRYLKVTREGRIWAAPAVPPSADPATWTVHDLEGREIATLLVPARFEPHDIGPDFVLGRFRDELDVNFIRLYRLEKPEGSPPGPGLDRAVLGEVPFREPEPRRLASDVPAEARELIRQAFMAAAMAQEIHYSRSYTYTTDLPALLEELPRGREVPPGVEVGILVADDRGWIGAFTHVPSRLTCALAYGAHLPMGWPPGSLVCP